MQVTNTCTSITGGHYEITNTVTLSHQLQYLCK